MAIDPNQTADKIICQPAEAVSWNGRSVRLVGGKVPVCTSTYNYCQSNDTRNELARRIAALWTLAVGMPTSEIEEAVSKSYKLGFRK